MKYLNGFILIGIVLLILGVAGLLPNSRLLTEPGQTPDPYAWLKYLAAAMLMLVNGVVSIWTTRRSEQDAAAKSNGAASADKRPAK